MKSYPETLLAELKKVEKVTDRLGMPVDEDIKLLVAALWAHDVPTDISCGGHEDRRNGGPFIGIESSEASKLGRSMYGNETTLDGKEEVVLLNKIRLLNLAEQGYVIRSLDGFYEKRKCDAWVRLVIVQQASGRCRIACQGASYVDAFHNDTDRLEWLKCARKELADFTQFLIKELDD